MAKFFGRVVDCAIFAGRGSFSITVLFFFIEQKVCSIQHSEKDCSEVFRNSSYVYRGTFRRQRDSKRKMTVRFFDELTGQFSILLSNLLSTCPEELFDSFFQNILSTFLSEWEQMVSDFWQIASGSVVKIAFRSSIGLLRAVSDERNMKLKAKNCLIFKQ